MSGRRSYDPEPATERGCDVAEAVVAISEEHSDAEWCPLASDAGTRGELDRAIIWVPRHGTGSNIRTPHVP